MTAPELTVALDEHACAVDPAGTVAGPAAAMLQAPVPAWRVESGTVDFGD